MNKLKRKPLLDLVGILTVIITIGFILGLFGLITAIQTASFNLGRDSVVLEDLCVELTEIAIGTDFAKGYGFQVFECTVNTGDWKDDWEIPEEFDIEETDEGVIVSLGENEILLKNIEIGELEEEIQECDPCPEPGICTDTCSYDIACVAMGHCPTCPKSYARELVETQILLDNCQMLLEDAKKFWTH